MKRPLRTLVLPAAMAALALSACGSSTNGSASSSHAMSGMSSMSSSTTSSTSSSAPAGSPAAAGQHSSADIAFATGMIPHHAQAVQMADMALQSAHNTEVKALAAQVKAAQDPEIRTMSGWLTSWGQPVPPTMAGHGMSAIGGGMSGMMSSKDMASLGRAHGAAFDRMWLTMMTTHHHGAVAMARTELTQGRYPAAKALAGSVLTSQTKQITSMNELLRSSGMSGMSGM